MLPLRLAPSPLASRARGPQRERGIALLIVLLLMIILMPFAFEFQRQVYLEARTAQNVADQLALENGIDGQFEIVLARLQYDASEDEVDSLQDSWNDDELKERREEETDVAISTRLFDEQGKFNVLLLMRAPADRRQVMKDRLVRILVEARKDTREMIDEGLAKELVDDAFNFLSGTKGRGAIPKPPTPDDRGFLVLEDLALCNSKWRDLLVDKRNGDEVAAGLHRYLTVYGAGKVNLNTADPVVLRAFFPSDESIATKIVERREGEQEDTSSSPTTQGSGTTTPGTTGGTTGPGASSPSGEEDAEEGNPFTDVNQVSQLEGVDPQTFLKDKVDLAADFDVKTSFFAIRILAESLGTRRDELYVVERVRGQAQGGQQPGKVEGFRHHLHQERLDALEDLGDGR